MSRIAGRLPIRGGGGGGGGGGSGLWVDPVLNRTTSTPPVSPTPGDRYIVASVATGDWVGQENNIAEWNGSLWDFTVVAIGMTTYVVSETEYYSFNGSDWVMESFAPHNTTHESGGSDQISVAGLSGVLADAQIPDLHYPTHETGGLDQITVENLITGGEVDSAPVSNGTGGLFMGFPDALTIRVECRKASPSSIPIGTPVYIAGYNAGLELIEVEVADASDPAKMPAIGCADTVITQGSPGHAHAFGHIDNFDTTGGVEAWSVGDSLYVSPGGGLTNVKPTGTNQIQKIAEVLRVHATLGEMMVFGAGRTNDVPNLADGFIWKGDASGVAQAVDFAHAASHEPGGADAMTVDAVAGTGSLRTLGTGAQQACAGNDSRLSDARTPTSHAASHQNGGGDEVATVTAAANAIPKAGGAGKLDIGWMPDAVVGGMNYQGTWNASTNTPTLSDATGTKGHYYVVSVAGTQNLGSGSISYNIGDWVVHNGTIYEKIDNTDAVTSVFTRTGAVTAQSGDYTHAQIGSQTADDHHPQLHTVASHSDTAATGAQLNTLTDASNADALHAHAHSAVTGKTANDHHNELHTVASHSDTTATGAELETLTNGSNSDSLHKHTEAVILAVTDEVSPLATGAAQLTFRMPYGFVLSAVRANVKTAPTGSVITVDINEGGTTILSTKITIDADEKTSVTAAVQPVISDANLADDAEITVDIDTVGSTVAGAGLKIALIGTKS